MQPNHSWYPKFSWAGLRCARFSYDFIKSYLWARVTFCFKRFTHLPLLVLEKAKAVLWRMNMRIRPAMPRHIRGSFLHGVSLCHALFVLQRWPFPEPTRHPKWQEEGRCARQREGSPVDKAAVNRIVRIRNIDALVVICKLKCAKTGSWITIWMQHRDFHI